MSAVRLCAQLLSLSICDLEVYLKIDDVGRQKLIMVKFVVKRLRILC